MFVPHGREVESAQAPFAGSASAHQTARVRRRISYDSGRALELLGHAIEYLADELVHDAGTNPEYKGRIAAIQLLMAANRRIYLGCPIVPRLEFIQRVAERISHAFHFHSGPTPT